MKRIHIATLGITLAIGTAGTAWAQQAYPGSAAGFGPLPPPTNEMRYDESLGSEPQAASTPQAPAPEAVYAPPPSAPEVVHAPQPSAPEVVYAPQDAAPEAPPRSARRDPNPETGPYIGHGLFDKRGPNDFGA